MGLDWANPHFEVSDGLLTDSEALAVIEGFYVTDDMLRKMEEFIFYELRFGIKWNPNDLYVLPVPVI